jgi:uncharacterized protein (TIGR00369 family)
LPLNDPDSPDPDPANPTGARHVPFLDLLHIQPVMVPPGQGRVEVTVRPEHLRNLGILHGGMLAVLMDSAMGMAAGSTAPAGHFVVTVQLNINFIRPAWEGEHLVASGEVRHSGQQTAVARGEVHTARGVLVGSGSGTFMYLRHSDPHLRHLARQDDEKRSGNVP